MVNFLCWNFGGQKNFFHGIVSKENVTIWGGFTGRNQENCLIYHKQSLDEVFVISRIIKVEVSVLSRSLRLRLITLPETLIIPDITKTETNNCFIIHCFEVISQLLAGSMKRTEKPFLLRCLRTWHWCPCTCPCSWKSCIACATYRLFTNL